MLDHDRALYQLSKHLKLQSGDLKNAVVWGNHSSTLHLSFSKVQKSDGKSLNKDGLKFDEIISTVQKRGSEIIQKRGFSSALSAATAICKVVNKWILGTEEGEIVSMAVFNKKNGYSIPEDICFSVPVTSKDGNWKLVEGLEVIRFFIFS